MINRGGVPNVFTGLCNGKKIVPVLCDGKGLYNMIFMNVCLCFCEVTKARCDLLMQGSVNFFLERAGSL